MNEMLYNELFNVQISQSNAATKLRRGGRIYLSLFHNFLENSKWKELLKLVYMCRSRKKWHTFYYPQCTF